MPVETQLASGATMVPASTSAAAQMNTRASLGLLAPMNQA
jgi:hypothetical protein